MKKVVWGVVFGFTIFGIFDLLLANNTDDEKLIGELSPGISGVTKNKFAITPGIKGKIESALGEKLGEGEEFEIYSGKNKEGEDVKAMLMPVKTPTNVIMLGVASIGTKMIGVKAFGDVNIESFLNQFIGAKYSLENLEKDLNLLKAALQKAQDGKDETAKEMNSLLKITYTMQKVGDFYPELSKEVKNKDATSKKYAGEILNAYKNVISATDNIKFLKKDDIAAFKNIAIDTQTLFDKIELSIENGNFDMPKDELKTLSKNYCGKCHSSFLKSFGEKRTSYDMGDGYFYVGHDVKPSEDKAVSQAIATAIKKALILMLESQK